MFRHQFLCPALCSLLNSFLKLYQNVLFVADFTRKLWSRKQFITWLVILWLLFRFFQCDEFVNRLFFNGFKYSSVTVCWSFRAVTKVEKSNEIITISTYKLTSSSSSVVPIFFLCKLSLQLFALFYETEIRKWENTSIYVISDETCASEMTIKYWDLFLSSSNRLVSSSLRPLVFALARSLFLASYLWKKATELINLQNWHVLY